MATVQTSYRIGTTTKHLHESGFYFDANTPDAVKHAIVSAYQSDTRVRIFLGDASSGESWHEEHDVVGKIGRSMGPCTVPLLLPSPRSSAGTALLDAHVIGIVRTDTRQWLYRHPAFNTGNWTVQPSGEAGYCESAVCGGVLHANFKTPGQAARYIKFMRGERFAK